MLQPHADADRVIDPALIRTAGWREAAVLDVDVAGHEHLRRPDYLERDIRRGKALNLGRYFPRSMVPYAINRLRAAGTDRREEKQGKDAQPRDRHGTID